MRNAGRWGRLKRVAVILSVLWCSAIASTVLYQLSFAGPSGTEPAPATHIDAGSTVGQWALVITAVFGGVAGIIGAVAQLVQARRNADEVAKRDELLIQLIARDRESPEDP